MSGDVIRIDRNTAWSDPSRAAPQRRGIHQVPERELLVRQAINDPGAFTARGYVADEAKEPADRYEVLTHWQARAVLIALADHLKD